MVVSELTFLVFPIEKVDSLFVFFFDAALIDYDRTNLRLSIDFDAFNRHHRHKVVSRVRKIWALEANTAEVVDCLASLVEVDDFTPCKQHESIKHLKDVRVRLVDSADDGAVVLAG